MSAQLLASAHAAVKAAKAKGAQGARASVKRNRRSTVEWRDGKLDRIRESTRMSMSITLYVDGRYSGNTTSDLRPEAIETFIAETVAATRVLAKDPHRKLPDPARYAGRFSGDLRLFDSAGSGAIDTPERRRVARDLEQAARAAEGADKIISVTAYASDGDGESAMVCSNGMEGSERSTHFFIGTDTTVKDEGSRRPSGWWSASSRYRAKLPSLESISRESVRRALLKVGAKPEKSGKYACVIENAVVGRLLRGLLSPLNGNAIQQKRSFLHDKVGQSVGSAALSFADEPLLAEGFGSRLFDGEGMTAIKRPVFEGGVLRSLFLDTYYASKLGMEPTTGGWSNLVFAPGTRALDALLKEMDQGILVTGFSGGNSNSATGDFSIGIRGMWVKDGKLARPVTGMNLAGNHLKAWTKLVELGSDPYPYSSNRSPSMRFSELQFSGK